MDAIRQHLEPTLARQSPHVVHPRVEVMWDVPYDITQVTMRVGQTVEAVPPEMVIRRVQSRERLMKREADDPFRYLCEPDEYRLIDLECARKRRANPGVPLLLWLSGGIRSAKTFCLSRRVSGCSGTSRIHGAGACTRPTPPAPRSCSRWFISSCRQRFAALDRS